VIADLGNGFDEARRQVEFAALPVARQVLRAFLDRTVFIDDAGTGDADERRKLQAFGFGGGDQFYNYLKDSFDVLYAEGETSPKMMSVGLHCRIVGRPGRAAALMRFLEYIDKHERVWVPTRLQIARHWYANLADLADHAPGTG